MVLKEPSYIHGPKECFEMLKARPTTTKQEPTHDQENLHREGRRSNPK